MAVFSTNLIIYKHTDFEQTFVLEDGQSNSAKDLTLMGADGSGVVDLTGYSAQSKLRKSPTNYRFADIQVGIVNASQGLVNISIASTVTKFLQGGRHVYDIVLIKPNGFKSVAVEGNALVRSGINTFVHYFGSP